MRTKTNRYCAAVTGAVISLILTACGGGEEDESSNREVSMSAAAKQSAAEEASIISEIDDSLTPSQNFPLTVHNGSFETGDFAGWLVDIPLGETVDGTPPLPVGVARVVSPSLRPAIDGNYILAIGSLDPGNSLKHDKWDISVSQKVLMRTGDKITGNSYYFNGDYIGQEVVWVRIYDVHGKLMSTPWQENSGYYPDIHHNSVPWLQSSEWKNWAWTATKSGIYTLKLGVSTCCDNEWATYAFHDDIKLALKDVNPHKPDNKK